MAQHQRRVPVALRKKVEQRLEELLSADIIEPVNEPSQWVSPLVVAVKDNGDLRLCVDMRRANTAIKRQTHPIPTLDDFLTRLKGARFFSRLDIKDAYHQVELDEESRHVTTFITHQGMYRYKRLMFGVCSAPEHFQRIMEQLLSKNERAMNLQDDIIVWGEDEETHAKALNSVLAVVRERGILLNNKKCEFGVQQTEFLGHHLSRAGVKPTDEKIQSVRSFRAPRTAEEVRSFLGLVSYIGRFIPDLATKTHSLRSLTKSSQKFSWGGEQQREFEQLKALVADLPTLAYFDNDRRTRLIADASPVGLGAVLVQFEDETELKPLIISFASKTLTPTETRYCQTEKEALALVWAVERFKIYLLGRKFELETDHRPLVAIFRPTSNPPARIERWVLRLQSFSFDVVYKKGKENIADPLSRLSVNKDLEEFDESDDNLFIRAVLESVAVDVDEIKQASDIDPQLSVLKDAITTGDWQSEQVREMIKEYIPFQNDLSLVEGYVVRGCRLVIPPTLRVRMLDLAHEGHPGETLMVSRLRDRVWWPGIDKDARRTVQQCEGCRLVSKASGPEPMTRRKMPQEPWLDLALDFLGPLPSGDYLLVVVDYFSRYMEVRWMRKITAEETMNHLEPIFVSLGYPRTITLDNARQFLSLEFSAYCKARNITLNHTTPYWPQANGEVERQNRSLLKRLRISNALKRDWKMDLLQFLMMYHSTPHSTTGKTPSELLRGRTIRSKLPSIHEIETAPPKDGEFRDRDIVRKFHGKEEGDKKRQAKPSNIQPGDKVLMKNLLPSNKLDTNFHNTEYTVVQKQGNRVTVREEDTNKTYDRNTAHLKRIPTEERLVSFGEPSYNQDDHDTSELNHDLTFHPRASTSSTPLARPRDQTREQGGSTVAPPIRQTAAERQRREVKQPMWQKDYLMTNESSHEEGEMW